MKASLKAKLDQLLERYDDLAALLSDSDTIADQETFRNYSKEYAEIEPVVLCYRSYEQTQAELAEAQLLARDADPDIRAMAEDELESLHENIDSLDGELQTRLLHDFHLIDLPRYEHASRLIAAIGRQHSSWLSQQRQAL